MAGEAAQCDGCGRMRYDVERVSLFVEGQARVEHKLCAVCRMEAIDAFIVAAEAKAPRKLVRDVYDWLPHRVATAGEKYGLLAAKFDEEVAEVKAASIGTPEFIEELGDLIEVCLALGGAEAVEHARLAKKARLGGFDRLLVMRLEDRTDK